MKALILILLFCLYGGLASHAAPGNDSFANAIVLTGMSAARNGSNVGATSEPGEQSHAFNSPASSIWYRWTAPTNGVTTISTAGSFIDTVLAVYTGPLPPFQPSIASLVPLTHDDDDGTLLTSKVAFSTMAGQTYYIAVDGYEGEMGSITISVNLQLLQRPANDNYADAATLTGGTVTISASNFLATLETGELNPTTIGGASVWWTWEAPTSEYYYITTGGSEFDTVLSLYHGTTLVAWNDDTEERAGAVHFKATKGFRYHFSVQGFNAEAGTVRLAIRPQPLPKAPAWSLVDMNGNLRRSSEFAGKVVILDFWATWCEPCLREIPGFIEMQNLYGPDGLVIIGVSTDVEGFDVVTPFVHNNGVNYISTVANSPIYSNYGPINAIPTTVVIDRDNNILARYVGEQSRQTFESILDPALFPPVPVALRAAREGNQIALRWPASATRYVLQSANANSRVWSNLNVTATISGNDFVARVPTSDQNRAYRLLYR